MSDIPSFDEFRRVLADLPGPDLEAATTVMQREVQLTKPRGALGRLESLTEWLATWQGRTPPRVQHPRVAVFAGNHGVAALGVSAYPSAVTAQMVHNFTQGGAAVNQLCGQADADLRVYELDLDNPTADFTHGPAMSEEACARAMAYGMMAVETGIDVLCLGEMGIGNSTSAAALCLALFGGKAVDWVGPGTGLDAEGMARKAAVVAAGIAANADLLADPFHVLRALGGYELAAIVGAIMAARMARTPVVLDGYACTAAAAVLYKLDPRALDHCIVGHLSAEPAHRRLLDAIGQEPLLTLGMRLGEGSGAALALPILQAAVACHTGMATFAEAGVSTRGGEGRATH
ncbi:nicotinate-nucleotide--dimethylbenzimidazole phosphoribosyltransferase [Nitrospirillum sp. BR 11163]|uniref:nicotinate-nucleotide--dimethylbenzimidazole phosphoribosyltransferase n=1 Tax=Nitrospirillum sp. BR 11163 TaxID=3104323 RepID=UPI002AFEA810|nr:nicotinate-nucleotide--dimethylbenzimidazole phosphoribosyltransferase [Nitrospirillum sp. BR 11163]MEA1675397.1 nicotinate-nucleotide--dimethylbenzimidazole phosphoribosyltransferase [Nitrospirillum sp. BR 11163]